MGRLLAPFNLAAEPKIAVAVSGGPDSLALAWGAAQALGRERVIALIVDHALRPESGAEAAAVQAQLEALHIEAVLLRWEHGAVESRIHVAARRARYDLLLAACRARGLRTLLLAHHRDDQAETILLRLAKGSGLDGLSGMAAETPRGDVRLIRPFLAVPKARLIATCKAQNLAYVTDPSNVSAKYARGRLRQIQTLLEPEGFTVERLLDLGDRAREGAQAVAHYAQELLGQAATVEPGGAVRLAAAPFWAVPRAVQLKALTQILLWFEPTPYPPERKPLVALLEALKGEEGTKARTLHGCALRRNETGDAIHIRRELAAIRDVQSLAPGQTILWDGRWTVSLLEGTEGGPFTLRALGLQPHDLLDQLAPSLCRKIPGGQIRATLPALWQGKVLHAIPQLYEEKQGVVRAVLQPFAERFSPA